MKGLLTETKADMLNLRVIVQEDDGERSYYGRDLSIVDHEIRLSDLDGMPRVYHIPFTRIVRIEVVGQVRSVAAPSHMHEYV